MGRSLELPSSESEGTPEASWVIETLTLDASVASLSDSEHGSACPRSAKMVVLTLLGGEEGGGVGSAWLRWIEGRDLSRP